jgi:hypothetical protein
VKVSTTYWATRIAWASSNLATATRALFGARATLTKNQITPGSGSDKAALIEKSVLAAAIP